jgi:hypothetical protein
MALPIFRNQPLIAPQQPRLLAAPMQYDAQYQEQYSNSLRLYFNQLDNAGPMAASTQRANGQVVAALSFIQPDPANPNAFVLSLPSQADLSNLRVGDVYYDSTAGNVLKVKT